ncbi:hypothetical protein [Cyanobium sp. ULC065]|nr:hypothetical protein [Synechococcus sp. CS-1333]
MTKGLPPEPVDPRTVVVPPGQPVKARSSSQASPQADRNSQSEVAFGGKARIHIERSPASQCHAGIGETIATEAEIWRTISAECVRIKELGAQFSGSLPLQSFAETEQKALARLGELVIPTQWLMETMRVHTSAQQRVVEVSKEILRSVSQVSADARDKLNGIQACLKFYESRLRPDEIQANLMEHAFLRAQLGLPTTGDILQKISSARIIPSPNNQHQVKPHDLEPKIYTSRELKDHLGCYDEATIRRKAIESWKEGAGPQPLKGLEGWYVVRRGNSDGGRRCGWKFQQRKRANEA